MPDIARRIGPEHIPAGQHGTDLTAVVSRIYARGLWGEGRGQDSRSGAGSTTDATRQVVGRFSAFPAETSCGDLDWMRGVAGDVAYLGLDVVPEVIADNVPLHGDARRRFLCSDATREPIEPGDVALCREVPFHLSFADGLRLLGNIRAAGFRHAVLADDTLTPGRVLGVWPGAARPGP